MQQFSRSLQQIEPLVRHGIQELQAGAPIDHTLREIALMGALVGSGVGVNQAIRSVERIEPQLLSFGGYERAETQFHPGVGKQQQAGYGVPYGYGKPQVGMPMGKGGVYGQQFGQQLPMTYAPSGTMWMGK